MFPLLWRERDPVLRCLDAVDVSNGWPGITWIGLVLTLAHQFGPHSRRLGLAPGHILGLRLGLAFGQPRLVAAFSPFVQVGTDDAVVYFFVSDRLDDLLGAFVAHGTAVLLEPRGERGREEFPGSVVG